MADNLEKIGLLRDLLNKGQISQDMFDTNVSKLQTLSQNVRPDPSLRAKDLSSVMDEIRNNRGAVTNIANEVKTATPGTASVSGRTALMDSVGEIAQDAKKVEGSSLGRLNGKFGKTLKALGILGPALGAMSVGEKAMAGDYGAAGMEAADQGLNYVPGLGEVKQAITPTELGNSELPDTIMKERALYNAQVANGRGINSMDVKEDEPIVDDQDNDTLVKRYSFLNKLK